MKYYLDPGKGKIKHPPSTTKRGGEEGREELGALYLQGGE
jgi:hypothetical protein